VKKNGRMLLATPVIYPCDYSPATALDSHAKQETLVIIAITNQKRRVGKTTTAINLAAAFAKRGTRTLLLDLDPQANSSISFLDPLTIERSAYELMMDGQGTDELPVYKTPVEGLHIIPARISLAKLESKLVGDFDAPFRLKDRIEPLKKTYKVIVIDTPPTLGLITVNALVASSHVLIPIQSSYFALEGTDDLLETIEKVKARPNPKLEIVAFWSLSTTSGRPWARKSMNKFAGCLGRSSSKP